MYIHNIDLHYHAGQERHEGVSLYDYLEHAKVTGRKILGVTDHFGKYIEPTKIEDNLPYSQDLEGLIAYKQELESLKKDFPTMKLLFCPEIGPRASFDLIIKEILDISDYFIFEAGFPHESIEKNTQHIIDKMQQVSEFTATTGKLGFIAHPFRSIINVRLVKQDIQPWVTTMESRPNDNFTIEEVNDFFTVDMKKLAEASYKYNVPLEVNGNTHERIRSLNLPVPYQLIRKAYKIMLENGASFVPGSDQHGFWKSIGRAGGYVPADMFAMLGLTADDIRFIKDLGLN